MSFEQILGGAIAVIVAGMPAMVALLKISELHVVVNSRLEAFIAATKAESDARYAEVREDLLHSRQRNDQLYEQLSHIAESIQKSSCPLLHPSESEKPPCTV